MKLNKLGTSPEGYKVEAVTDSLGPQVIVVGDGVHLISQCLKNHLDAVTLGNKIVAEGVGVYSDWIDVKKEPDGGLCHAMVSIFSRAEKLDREAEDFGDEVIQESDYSDLDASDLGPPPSMPW